jgi:hypothetical protein
VAQCGTEKFEECNTSTGFPFLVAKRGAEDICEMMGLQMTRANTTHADFGKGSFSAIFSSFC